MGKNVNDVSALVYDHGLFTELAIRLARDFKRVLYYTPWEKSFPTISDSIIGDGFRSIERVDEIWSILPDVDLAVFPDIMNSGLQLHLESMGIPVWGSRKGDKLELQRAKFLKTVDEAGLPVGKWRHVVGISNLRDILNGEEDVYVKISKYRGVSETWHHQNMKLSEPILDHLAVKLGSAKEIIPFVVCDAIPADLEVGFDGFCIDGQFPKIALQGWERKDLSYIASVQNYEDLPKQVVQVNEAMAPLLKDFRYRNFWSTEIRITDDGTPYFIDPTCRCPSPATEAQLELYDNLGEIIWEGAHGNLVDPNPVAKFAVEAMIYHNEDADGWRSMEIPDEVRQWVKLYRVCKINGAYHIPPGENKMDEIGAVVGIGDTIKEAIDHLHETVEELKDQPVAIRTEALYDALTEIQEAEKKGIEFTEQEVPKPETALQ